MKKTVVPQLRFPEFLGEEGWEQIRLGDLSTLITKGTTPTTLGYEYLENGPVKFVKIESLDGHLGIDSKKVVFISEECHFALGRSRLQENDILFSIAGALGAVALVSGADLPANTNQALAIVRLRQTTVPRFLANFLSSSTLQGKINGLKSGAAQFNISLEQVNDFQVPHPLLAEQSKIAACLSSLDDLVGAHQKKLESLMAHKKGLMQGLFPAEGESEPRLRFPEFRGEWTEKSLSQLMEFRNGLNAEKEKYGSGHKYISVLDVMSGKPITYSSIVSSVEISEKELESFGVEYGDILFQRSSETQEEAGQANVYVDPDHKAVFGGFVIRGRKTTDFDSGFMSRLLATAPVRQEITSRSAGSTRYNIGQESLAVISVSIPTLPEQQKIAALLSSIDDQITAQTRTIDALKLHKKGLMQQLFPRGEEE